MLSTEWDEGEDMNPRKLKIVMKQEIMIHENVFKIIAEDLIKWQNEQ